MRLHATINHLWLPLNIFATISCVHHICDYTTINDYFNFHPSMWTFNLVFIQEITTCVQLITNVTNLVIALWIHKGVFCVFLGIYLGILRFINVSFECIWTTILHVYSNIIVKINGFDIMVTLCVYFEYI